MIAVPTTAFGSYPLEFCPKSIDQDGRESWIEVCRFNVVDDPNSSDLQTPRGILITESHTPRLIVPMLSENGSTVTSVVATYKDGGVEKSLPVYKLTDTTGKEIKDYWGVNTSTLQEGKTYDITLRGLSSTGHLVKGDLVSIKPEDGKSSTADKALQVTDAWVSSTNRGYKSGIFFDGAALGGGAGNGKLYYRELGTTNGWSTTPKTVSNWGTDLSGLVASKTYEYLLDTGNTQSGGLPLRFHGQFKVGSDKTTIILKETDANGKVTFSGELLGDDWTTPNALNFSLASGSSSSLSDISATSYTIKLDVTDAAKKTFKLTKTFSKVGSDIKVSFSEAELIAAGIPISRWSNATYTYSYCVYANRVDEKSAAVSQFVGQSAGSVQLGSDPANIGARSVTGYRPDAMLKVTSGTITGDVTISGNKVGTSSNITAKVSSTDWRRRTSGQTVSLDLSQWLPTWGSAAATSTITVTYAATDGNFTATFTINEKGVVKVGTVQCQAREPKIPFYLPGATSMSMLKVGAADDNDATPAEMTLITSGIKSEPDKHLFTWDVTGLGYNDGKQHRFYYEGKNGSTLTNKGYGFFTMKADNTLSFSFDDPSLKPAEFRFEAPASTSTFELTVTEPTGVKTYKNTNPPNSTLYYEGGKYVFVAPTSLIPAPGNPKKSYACTYEATDNTGIVLNDGTGTLSVESTGACTADLVPGRTATVAMLYGPQGEKTVDRLSVEWYDVADPNKTKTTTVLVGTWNEAQKRNVFRWDLTDIVGDKDSIVLEYVMTLQEKQKDGTYKTFVNALGNEAKVPGQMTISPNSGDDSVSIKQYNTTLKADWQIRHMQSYNAFGEISSEYDDSTYERMKAMIELYGHTEHRPDIDAISTLFKYNNAGMLISKIEPQTYATAENGYQYRANPDTNYGYDLLGRINTLTDGHNFTSRQTFAGDGEHRMVGQWDAAGGYKSYGYDTFGDQRWAKEKLNSTQTSNVNYTYDKLGNMTQAVRTGITRVQDFVGKDPEVGTTITDKYTYDSLGHRISHTNTYGWTPDKTYYDGLNRVRKTVSAGGSITTYDYQFIAIGASGGIWVAGKDLGGYKVTTTQASQKSTVDKIDYFDRTVWHQDMGGFQYTYSYTTGGKLSSQTSTHGQSISYTYYDNGFIKEAKDLTHHTITLYGYDNAGNRVSESYGSLDPTNTYTASYYQSSKIAYDELNRMAFIEDEAYEIKYEYDIASNRRAVFANYIDPLTQGERRSDELWYTYDAANRFTISMGKLTGVRGTSVDDTRTSITAAGTTSGVALSYDLGGRRISAKYGDKPQEDYTYTTDGFLEDAKVGGKLIARRRVDALGRTLEYLEYDDQTSAIINKTETVYTYDNRIQKVTVDGVNAKGSTDYLYYNPSGTFDANGRGELAQTKWDAIDEDETDLITNYTYEYWDSAKQKTIKVRGINDAVDHWKEGFSDFYYDDNGFLEMASDHVGDNDQVYVSNATAWR